MSSVTRITIITAYPDERRDYYQEQDYRYQSQVMTWL